MQKIKVLELKIWNLRFLEIIKYHLRLLPVLVYCTFQSACNTENAPDCLQNAGDIIREEVTLPNFSKITVFENISLVLRQGDTQKVEIETGEFLFEEVKATLEDDRLILRNENGCNFFREYGLTTVYITSPNITEIRSSTGFPIQSDGILAYPSLTLLSESFVNPETETTDGEFDLEVDSESVNIATNGIAYFKLRGTVENLNLSIAAGDSRIEAENLMAENITLNHRGSNDMLINPQLALTGVIRGTGDVISFNQPAEVDVEEIFNGRLIFQ
jgi:hypothetical protein